MGDLDPTSVLDLDVVETLKSLEGDGEGSLFAELVDLFVEDATGQLRAIERALAEGDASTIERCAHTLKSSSASLGASHLSEICFELEQRGRSGSLAEAEALVRATGEALRQACRALESVRP